MHILLKLLGHAAASVLLLLVLAGPALAGEPLGIGTKVIDTDLLELEAEAEVEVEADLAVDLGSGHDGWVYCPPSSDGPVTKPGGSNGLSDGGGPAGDGGLPTGTAASPAGNGRPSHSTRRSSSAVLGDVLPETSTRAGSSTNPWLLLMAGLAAFVSAVRRFRAQPVSAR